MRVGIVLYSNDPERTPSGSASSPSLRGTRLRIFLLGKGKEQMDLFLENGGKLIACGVCLEVRNSKEDATCPVGSMNDLYELTSWADRILTF